MQQKPSGVSASIRQDSESCGGCVVLPAHIPLRHVNRSVAGPTPRTGTHAGQRFLISAESLRTEANLASSMARMIANLSVASIVMHGQAKEKTVAFEEDHEGE